MIITEYVFILLLKVNFEKWISPFQVVKIQNFSRVDTDLNLA